MADLRCIQDCSSTNDDWNDFNGFEGEDLSGKPKVTTDTELSLEEGLPRNCANAQVVSSSDLLSDSTSYDLPEQLSDLLARCFCRTATTCEKSKKSTCSPLSSCSTGCNDVLIGNPIWETVINNVGNVLPVDWLTTHAHRLLLGSLNIAATKQDASQCSVDLDLSEDEELQQAFDMHCLIVSSVHQDIPMFTAEQVIREIEDMLEEPHSPSVSNSDQDDVYASELLKMRERSQARIAVTKERIADVEGMSAGALSELYDELDAVVRELSEELILELARRDELEYEKELKNQFIALLLSIQRRQRELIDSKRRGASSAKATEGAYGGNQPGCFLTTLIPYSDNMVPPSIEHLQIYVKILTAINEDSPTVPALLTDYILKVICPTV